MGEGSERGGVRDSESLSELGINVIPLSFIVELNMRKSSSATNKLFLVSKFDFVKLDIVTLKIILRPNEEWKVIQNITYLLVMKLQI